MSNALDESSTGQEKVFVTRHNHLKSIKKFIFSDSGANTLYVNGEGGAGKSWLAGQLTKELLQDEDHVSFVSTIELVDTWYPEDLLLTLYSSLSCNYASQSLPALKRFVFAYLRLMERRAPGKLIEVGRRYGLSRLTSKPETVYDAADVAANLATEAVEELGAAGRLLQKGWKYASDKKLRKKYPELEELEGLPIQDLSEKLQEFFIADLSRWARANKKAQVTLIIDNIDALQALSARPNEKSITGLLRKICNRCPEVKIIIFGRPKCNWIFPDGRYVKEKVKAYSIGQLSRDESKELITLSGISQGELCDVLMEHSRLPNVIQLKCDWINDYRNHHGVLPSANEVPKQLPELFDRLLAFRSEEEQLLMRALVYAEKFDYEMLTALAVRLNLPLSEASFSRIIHSTSVVDTDGHWMKFHDLLSEHLLYHSNLKPQACDFEQLRLTIQVILHLIEDRSENSSDMRLGCNLHALSLSTNLSGFWQSPKLQDLLGDVLNAFSEQVDKSPELDPVLLTEVLDRISRLFDDTEGTIAKTSRQYSALNKLVYALGRFGDHLANLVLSPMTSHDPELSLKFLENVKEIVRTASINAVGSQAKFLAQEEKSLAVQELLVRRVLPADYEGSFIRISTRAEFVSELQGVSREFAELLDNKEVGRIGYLITAAVSYSRLSRSADRNDRMAIDFFERSSQYLRAAVEKSEGGSRILIEQARHLLYPVSGMTIAVPDLVTATQNLRYLIENGESSNEVFHLLVRAQIRVAQKRKDEEISCESEWWLSLDETEDFLIQLDKKYGSRNRAGRIRLLLRVLRKRYELGAPASDNLNAFEALLKATAEEFPTMSSYLFWSILKEMRAAICEERFDGDELTSILFTQLKNNELSEWRTISAIQFLYKVWVVAEKKQDSCLELFSIIVSTAGLEFYPQGAYLKSVARRNLTNEAIGKLISDGCLSSIQEVIDLSGKFLRNNDGRKDAVEFGEEKLSLCEDLLRSGRRKHCLKLLNGLERQFLLFLPDNLSVYRSILKFKLKVFESKFSTNEKDQIAITIDRLNICLDADVEIGSLLYSSIHLSQGRRWWQGGQLIYKALALSENNRTIDPVLKQTVRSEFATQLWNRLVYTNSRDKNKKVVLPDRVLKEFVDAEKLTEDVFLRFLYALPIEQYRPGVLGVAKLTSAISSIDPDATEFLLDGKKVLVKHDLLSEVAHNRIFSEVEQAENEKSQNTSETLFLINLINATDGIHYGSSRGSIFVKSGLEFFLPGITWARLGPKRRKGTPDRIVMGGNNSWCLARTDASSMTLALAGRSMLVREVQSLLGVKRITFVPEAKVESLGAHYNEFRHFVNNSWADLRVQHISSRAAILDASQVPGVMDIRKLRRFRSMFEKVYPEKRLIFSNVSNISELQQNPEESFSLSSIQI